MKSRKQIWLAASIPAKKTRKRDVEGREENDRKQRIALDEAMSQVDALCEKASAGDASGFIAALDDPCVDTKNVSALPIRISIQLSSCPSCECGLMAISMHSGTGQQQKVEAVGQVEIRAHFASEICLPPRPSA